MRRFNVTVNGKTFTVEAEEVGTGQVGFTCQPVQQTATTNAVMEPTTDKLKSTGVGSETICAPMPGTVLEIRVSEGQLVKAGEIILILEAMKMENEITAPINGTVTKVHTSRNVSVSTGDSLITIG